MGAFYPLKFFPEDEPLGRGGLARIQGDAPVTLLKFGEFCGGETLQALQGALYPIDQNASTDRSLLTRDEPQIGVALPARLPNQEGCHTAGLVFIGTTTVTFALVLLRSRAGRALGQGFPRWLPPQVQKAELHAPLRPEGFGEGFGDSGGVRPDRLNCLNRIPH